MILLVGVAHVIDLREALKKVLQDFAPTAVAVELDPDRFQALVDREKDRAAGRPPVRKRGAPMLLRVWSSVQDRLAADLGDVPGSEMLVAYSTAQEMNVPLFLVDDPIRQVAPRLMNSLSVKERVGLMLSSVIALVTPSQVVQKGLAQYTQDRESYVQAMREQFPSVARVLIDERNLHMAQRLEALSVQFSKVAAVVGDAHISGLEGLLKGRAEVSIRHLVGSG